MISTGIIVPRPPPQLLDVVAHAGQGSFQLGSLQTPQQERSHPAPVLELADGRLDRLTSQTVGRPAVRRTEQQLHGLLDRRPAAELDYRRTSSRAVFLRDFVATKSSVPWTPSISRVEK